MTDIPPLMFGLTVLFATLVVVGLAFWIVRN